MLSSAGRPQHGLVHVPLSDSSDAEEVAPKPNKSRGDRQSHCKPAHVPLSLSNGTAEAAAPRPKKKSGDAAEPAAEPTKRRLGKDKKEKKEKKDKKSKKLSDPVAPPAADGQTWFMRCRRILNNCLAAEAFPVIAPSVASWPVADVHRVCGEWEPEAFACAFCVESVPAERLVQLLALQPATKAAKVCESYTPEDLVQLVPLLKAKLARQILESLYFKRTDR